MLAAAHSGRLCLQRPAGRPPLHSHKWSGHMSHGTHHTRSMSYVAVPCCTLSQERIVRGDADVIEAKMIPKLIELHSAFKSAKRPRPS
jgi:hypothetical protein